MRILIEHLLLDIKKIPEKRIGMLYKFIECYEVAADICSSYKATILHFMPEEGLSGYMS